MFVSRASHLQITRYLSKQIFPYYKNALTSRKRHRSVINYSADTRNKHSECWRCSC